MNLKKFLKPNTFKIVLFLLILTIFVFLPIVSVLVYVVCVAPPCPPMSDLTSVYNIMASFDKRILLFTVNTCIVIFLEILVSYFITCCVAILIRRKNT